MARLLSVTVSMAEDRIGMLSGTVFVTLLVTTTSVGMISDDWGTSRTSSNVSPTFDAISRGLAAIELLHNC